MDRADYFKKKGSTVDAKFARLHRRSIDQRNVRGMGFMDNRILGSLDELAFSPVKEDRMKAAMPPPIAAPPKAKKGNGSHTKPTPAQSAKVAIPAAGMTRRDKLMKWREEKEMKRKQMASKAKPQVFRTSKAVDHTEDAKLFMSSKTRAKSAAKPAAKPVSRPAPTAQRATRSSTKSTTKPAANGVKDTSRTRVPVKKVEPVSSTRARRGPPPPCKAPSSRMPRSVSSDQAPSTRQSARLASKQPGTQVKTSRSSTTRGAKKQAPVVEEPTPVVEEEVAEIELEPAKPVIDEATFNVTNQRGSSILTDTFAQVGGFTFSMAVPDLPFTPISPASASIFLFPTAKTPLTPSQRRCSTPYSLRPLRSLGQQSGHGPIPPQPDMTEQKDIAMETETCKPSEAESAVKPEAENIPEMAENERSPVPQKEIAMETETTVKTENNVNGEAVSEELVESRKPSEGGETLPAQEKDVPYFKCLVSSETTRLLERYSIWEKIMSDKSLSDEVCGEIRSTIGKAKLLIDQRFKQFLGLIKDCEFGLGEKVTHCSDLEGFWEMIYFQVEDVDALFKELEKLQANNWLKEEKIKPKIIKKKKPVIKKAVGGDAAAKRIAARERLLAAKAAMQAKATRKTESEKVVFEGGFFKVESPARKATPVKSMTKEHRQDGLSRQALQNRTNIMASPATTMCSPALQKMSILASPASTMCSPALQKRTNIMASPGSTLCSPALQKRAKLLASPATNLCSPLRRKTRKSSMGFGLSQAASLFTPEKDTPERSAMVQDLISWD